MSMSIGRNQQFLSVSQSSSFGGVKEWGGGVVNSLLQAGCTKNRERAAERLPVFPDVSNRRGQELDGKFRLSSRAETEANTESSPKPTSRVERNEEKMIPPIAKKLFQKQEVQEIAGVTSGFPTHTFSPSSPCRSVMSQRQANGHEDDKLGAATHCVSLSQALLTNKVVNGIRSSALYFRRPAVLLLAADHCVQIATDKFMSNRDVSDMS